MNMEGNTERDQTTIREHMLREAREQDVKFVRLWFTDILGHLKGFAIKVEDLEDAIDPGIFSLSPRALRLRAKSCWRGPPAPWTRI